MIDDKRLQEVREDLAFGLSMIPNDGTRVHVRVLSLQALLDELDRTRAERDKYHDALVARHGGEPVALLDELDAARAELERLRGLVREYAAVIDVLRGPNAVSTAAWKRWEDSLQALYAAGKEIDK